MNAAANVVVNIVINSSSTQAGVQQYNAAMQTVVRTSQNAAKESALSFQTIFGANFFADLFANIVRAAIAGGQQLISEAVRISIAFESAFAGLRGIGRNLGLNPQDVQGAVEGLDLVKSGLLTVNDAATSVKNLLATGFSLDQAIELVKRFADTAAFGRQASLSFGYAIASATEGVKNQNSILVDNAGVTKNLSVILAEQGFLIQDLSDKVKGAAARQALYTGLIKETKIQQGDANRLLETAQGRFVQLESAQTRALKGLGDFITQSKALNAVLAVLIVVLDALGKSAGSVVAVAVAVGILTASIIALNTAQLAALPVIRELIASIVLMGRVMVGTAGLVQGATATLLLQVAAWSAVALIIAAVIYAIYKYTAAENAATSATAAQVSELIKEQSVLREQRELLASVALSTEDTGKKQDQLKTIYDSLTIASQARVRSMGAEISESEKLRKELERLLELKNQELVVNARLVAVQLVDKLRQAETQSRRAETLLPLVAQPDTVAEQLRRGQGVTREQAALDPFLRSIQNLDVERQIELLNQRTLELSQTVRDARKASDEFSQAADSELKKLIQLAPSLGLTTDEIVRQSFQYKLINGDVNEAIALIQAFENRQRALQPAVKSATEALIEQIKAIDALGVAERQGERRKVLKSVLENIAESAKTPEEAKKALTERRKQVSEVDTLIKEEQRVQKNQQVLDEAVGLKKPAQQRHVATEAEQLTKRVKDLTAAVDSFANLSAKEFVLRFRAENLERQKRDLERILDLRRELNLQDVQAALPRTAAGARAQVEQLESLLRVQDGVKNALEETRTADEQLAVAMRVQVIPVLNAGTRAEIQYSRAVRERADAEQQLTADLIVAERLRADTLKDEIGRTKQGYQSLKLDLLKQLGEIDNALEQNKLLEAIQSGGEIDIEQKISGRVHIEQPKVPTELMQIASATKALETHVAEIAKVVTAGKGKTLTELTSFIRDSGFEVVSTTGGRHNVGSLHALGRAADVRTRGQSDTQIEALMRNAREEGFTVFDERTRPKGQKVWGGPHIHIQFGEQSLDIPAGASPSTAARVGRNVETLLARKEFPEKFTQAQQQDEDVIRTTTTASRFTVKELEQQVRQGLVDKELSDANRAATEEIKMNELRLHNQLIDFDKDVALHRSRSNVQREREERETAITIRLENERLAKIDRGDPEELRRLQLRVDEDRVRSRIEMRERLLSINDDIAHSGEDAALREEIAFKEAQLEIVKAHEQASESIIRSQVRINEQLVFSADIANAKVLDFIAQQKGVTDIIADAKVSVIQTTYDFIDRGLDKITRKLGTAGSLIKSITSDLLKLLVNRYFLRLFGLEGSTAQAATGGLGQFNPFALVGSVLRPAGANVGSTLNQLTLTGGFAGGASPAATRGFNFSQQSLNSLNPFSQFLSSNTTAPLGFLPTTQQANLLASAAQGGLGTAAASATSAATKTGIGATIAGALPLLGLSAGASLGGGFFKDSRAANAIGTVAGGALGLSAGLAGFLALGGTLGSGTLASAAGVIAGALPIIAPIAIAALIASFFINRSALRRKEETLRSDILIKARNDIDALITQVKGGKLDGASAVATAMAIRQQYLTDVGQLKDSKTRRIAQETVRELDYRINILKGAAAKADAAVETDKLLVPTFADGGIFRASDVSFRTTMGGFSRRDRHLALLADDETVITPQHRAALGGNAAFARAGVPGYSDGRSPARTSTSGAELFKNAVFLVVPDEDTADAFITNARPDVLVRKVRTHVKRNSRNSGLMGDIMSKLSE